MAQPFKIPKAECKIVVITLRASYLHRYVIQDYSSALTFSGGWVTPVQPGQWPLRGGRPGRGEGGEAEQDEGAGKGMGCRPQSCFSTQQVPTSSVRRYILLLPICFGQVQPGLPSLSQWTLGTRLVQAWLVANTVEARKLCPFFGKNLTENIISWQLSCTWSILFQWCQTSDWQVEDNYLLRAAYCVHPLFSPLHNYILLNWIAI